jgi:hypothetical protein
MAITRTQIAKQLLAKGGTAGSNGGSMLVTPTRDGSRPGYYGPDAGFGDVESRAKRGPRDDPDRFGPSNKAPTEPTGKGEDNRSTYLSDQYKKPTNITREQLDDRLDRARDFRETLKFKKALNKKTLFDRIPNFGFNLLGGIFPSNQKYTKEFLENNPQMLALYNSLSEDEKKKVTNSLKGITNKDGKTYEDFLAFDKGAPGLKYAGDVGGLDKYVSKYEINPDGTKGKPLEFGYRQRDDYGEGRNATSDYERRLRELEQSIAANPITSPVDDEIINYRLMADGGTAREQYGTVGQYKAPAPSSPSGKGEDGPPTNVGSEKPILIADATTTPTAGAFGFNLMELKRLQDAGYDPEEVSEGGYSEDLLKALQPIVLADGGRAGLAGGGMPYEGGIMDLESARQMYGLGKLVKKVTRGVKKIAKSPIGKVALGAALFKFGSPFFKSDAFKNFMFKDGVPGFSTLTNKGILAGIGAISGISGLMTKEEDEEPLYAGADIADPNYIMDNPQLFLNRRLSASGGLMRTGYQEGSKEPVAKKVMPLLDMDGQEKDYRETGGFVDMGRMEKADDVPARLSKNEFVFTADAVRNAGDGSVDKGAEVMYNMMKNLEAGGDVSEESQGLEGARKMFQTSQRLEEVL